MEVRLTAESASLTTKSYTDHSNIFNTLGHGLHHFAEHMFSHFVSLKMICAARDRARDWNEHTGLPMSFYLALRKDRATAARTSNRPPLASMLMCLRMILVVQTISQKRDL